MILEILIIAVVFFFATAISNLTGFGTGTISVPIVIRLMPFGQTLLVTGIIQWLSGLWKMVGFFKYVKWLIVIVFGIPALIASAIGSSLIFFVSHDILFRLLGLFIIIYSMILIFKPNFSIKATWYNTLIEGTVYGLAAGAFGVRGPIRTVFLTSLPISKREYIATSGAISLTADISRLFVYIFGGVKLGTYMFYSMFLFIPMSILGAYIGQTLVNIVPEKQFQIIISIFLSLVGFSLLIFGTAKF